MGHKDPLTPLNKSQRVSENFAITAGAKTTTEFPKEPDVFAMQYPDENDFIFDHF